MEKEEQSENVTKLQEIKNVLDNFMEYDIQKTYNKKETKDNMNLKEYIDKNAMIVKLNKTFSNDLFYDLLDKLTIEEKDIFIDYIDKQYIIDLLKKNNRKDLKLLIYLKPFFKEVIYNLKLLNTENLFIKNVIKNFCKLLSMYLKNKNN